MLSLALACLVAQPVPVERDWSLIRTYNFAFAAGARWNPVDRSIWVARRLSTTDDGIFRLGRTGRAVKIAASSNPASLMIGPRGEVFFSEDFDGYVFRVRTATSPRELWLSGFHAGDDDPVGMAFAPLDNDGSVIPPGTALVADRGANGPDEIWSFGLTTPAPALFVADDGVLVDPLDVAIGADAPWLIDSGEALTGAIYKLGPGGSKTKLVTSRPIDNPFGVDIERRTGDLFVADQASGSVLRVRTATGGVSTVVTGLVGLGWGSVRLADDDRLMIVTEGGKIDVFARCDVTPGDPGDCDGNGVLDACDLARDNTSDCNLNGVLDRCDIAQATSADCDRDGVPDECPQCPPVDVVFYMDTSQSMDDEAVALCGQIDAIRGELSGAGIDVRASFLGIGNHPGGSYSCLTGDVLSLYGTTLPGSPPPELGVFGTCPVNTSLLEDWGRATAMVAAYHPWSQGAIRLAMPIADEGPYCGDPPADPGIGRVTITYASSVAASRDVIVSPVVASGATAQVFTLARDLAAATGGESYSTTAAARDLPASVLAGVRSACRAGSPTPTCGLDAGLPDLGVDGGTVDSGLLDGGDADAATATDAALDATAADATVADATGTDAGAIDAEPLDAVVIDAAAEDAEALDARAADVGILDAGKADAGRIDAGQKDAGHPSDVGDEEFEVITNGCGCSAARAESSSLAPAILALGLVLLRRRR